MRLSYSQLFFLACACLPSLFGRDATAATYVDPQNQVTLTVTPSPSGASGHVAWRFNVIPVDSAREVSSIDAATGVYGFLGADFRQVNPSGVATIFTDFNAFFPTGENETTDTQFLFLSSALTLVPGSIAESGSELEASFTSFEPIRTDSENTAFAQVVLPRGSAGEFRGAFAVRPMGGGVAQLAEFGPIAFSIPPGDYNLDGSVDAADYTVWLDSLGQTGAGLAADGDGSGTVDQGDYDVWKVNFGAVSLGSGAANGSGASNDASVPEPSTLCLLLAGLIGTASRRRLQLGNHSNHKTLSD